MRVISCIIRKDGVIIKHILFDRDNGEERRRFAQAANAALEEGCVVSTAKANKKFLMMYKNGARSCLEVLNKEKR